MQPLGAARGGAKRAHQGERVVLAAAKRVGSPLAADRPQTRQAAGSRGNEPAAAGSPPPSKVLHVSGLPPAVTDAELVEALSKYGAVAGVKLMPQFSQALVEMAPAVAADVTIGARSVAMSVLDNAAKIRVRGAPVQLNFSKSKEIGSPGSPGGRTPPVHQGERVVLATVNSVVPQPPQPSVEAVRAAFTPFGEVARIVIFQKKRKDTPGFGVFVEYAAPDQALRAQEGLNGEASKELVGYGKVKVRPV